MLRPSGKSLRVLGGFRQLQRCYGVRWLRVWRRMGSTTRTDASRVNGASYADLSMCASLRAFVRR